MTEKPNIEFQIYDWVEDHFIEDTGEEEDENKKISSDLNSKIRFQKENYFEISKTK